MSLLPLFLGVRPPSDAEISLRDAKVSADKILRRDDFTCRFCGFQARKYQRVIPCAAAGTPPFATACAFCEQSFYLERTGLTGSGFLIWLPELTQGALHHILRAIYIARQESQKQPALADLGNLATRALDMLTARRADAKKRLGSDDPMLLATVIQEALTPDEQQRTIAKLNGVRFLPPEKYMVRGPQGDVNGFPAMVRYWVSPEGPYVRMPVAEWTAVFKQTLDSVGNA